MGRIRRQQRRLLRRRTDAAIFFATATSEVLLRATSQLEAMNEVGAQGWEDCRIDLAPAELAKPAGMPAARNRATS